MYYYLNFKSMIILLIKLLLNTNYTSINFHNGLYKFVLFIVLFNFNTTIFIII